MTSSHPVPSSEAPSLLSASAKTFMNPAVSPFSTARPTRVIGRVAIRVGLPRPFTSASVIPALPSGGSIECVGGNAVTDPARLPVEEVCGNDLEIIIGGVGEGAFAVAVAERPHSRHVGAQLIVDDDVTSLVSGDTGFVEPKIVGVRATPDREEQMGPANLGWSVCAIEANEDVLAAAREPDALRLDAQPYAFAFDNLGDCG